MDPDYAPQEEEESTSEEATAKRKRRGEKTTLMFWVQALLPDGGRVVMVPEQGEYETVAEVRAAIEELATGAANHLHEWYKDIADQHGEEVGDMQFVISRVLHTYTVKTEVKRSVVFQAVT